MAKRKDVLFTGQERRMAVWVVAIAVATASTGLLVEQVWRRPSLGPDGAASYSFASVPGVLDARPIG
jgi:hypothetical protein